MGGRGSPSPICAEDGGWGFVADVRCQRRGGSFTEMEDGEKTKEDDGIMGTASCGKERNLNLSFFFYPFFIMAWALLGY